MIWAWTRRLIHGAREDIFSFLDKWNAAGLVVIAVLVVWNIWPPISVPETNQILVLLTAMYVLTSFNQMREVRRNRPNYEARPVQPYFEYDESWGFEVPMVRNFGSSPAVLFQLLAQVEGIEDEPFDVERIERYEDPVNLNPGEEIPLMNDILADKLENADGWSDEAKMNLYYGFESIHAGDTAPALGLGKSLDDLEIEYSNPKFIKLDAVHACYNKSRIESPERSE